MSTKQFLLDCAAKKVYFDLPQSKIDALWETSSRFIDSQRSRCSEGEWYDLVEQHLFLAILTKHDVVAKQMLKRIVDEFGKDSHRVTYLRTAYSQAKLNSGAFERFLLTEVKDTDFEARKLALRPLRKHKPAEYIEKMLAFVENDNPADAAAWTDLAGAYADLGDFDTAIGCLQQVLVLQPQSFSAFARIGELRRLQAARRLSTNFAEAKQLVSLAIDNCCRSVELNPDYVRGWCGVLVTTALATDEQSGKLHECSKKQIKRLLSTNMPVDQEDDLLAAQKLLELNS